MLPMSVSVRGLLGAAWLMARALSLLAIALVVARWSSITEGPRHHDATPQLSFIFFVVLPLITFVLLGFLSDVWALSRRRSRRRTSAMRVVLALVSALLLGATLIRFLGYV